MLLRVILAIALLAPALTPARADPYAVEGLKLGTTLGELRRSPLLGNGGRLICNVDAEFVDIMTFPDLLPERDPSPSSSAPIACGIFRFGKRLEGSSLQAEWLPARFQLDSIEFYPALVFVVADGEEKSAQLARITIRSNATFWDQLMPALSKRYGRPAFRERTRLRYPDNELVTWDNGDSTIKAEKRSDRYQRTTVVLEHKALAALAGWRAAEIPGP